MKNLTENSLEDVLIYICQAYPIPHELSNARVNKIIYLLDWKSALDFGKQVTNIKWLFNHYGPYVEDIVSQSEKSQHLIVTTEDRFSGSRKFISINKDSLEVTPNISITTKTLLDNIIEISRKRSFQSFINFVYSTYPVATSRKMTELDLVSMAKKYKQINSQT